MKKSRFDQEQKKAFGVVADLLKTCRTVGILMVAAKCGRDNDPRWMSRIQNVFPEFIEEFNQRGLKTVAVNLHCIKYYADVPIDDITTATKCVQLRSGGAPPAGIRRVLPDDCVLDAHIRSLVELGCANVTGAISTSREMEARGLLNSGATQQLASKAQQRIQNVADLPPAPEQALLTDGLS